jgi:hypothetical protein
MEMAGLIVTVIVTLAGFGWWAARRLIEHGRGLERGVVTQEVTDDTSSKVDMLVNDKFAQEVARDTTRQTVARLDDNTKTLVTMTQEQNKELAVIRYQTADHGDRLKAVEGDVGELKSRVTVLETLKKETP